MPALEKYLNGASDKKNYSGKLKQRTFKVKRAEERHRSTLMELAENSLEIKQ